jgi:hypothetical protein
MTEPEPPSEGDPRPAVPRPEDPGNVEDWIRDALAESIFWPVLIVIALVGITLGAGILLFASLGRSLAAIAALAVIALMSVDIVRQEIKARGFGLVSKLVIGWWLASAVAAVAGAPLF